MLVKTKNGVGKGMTEGGKGGVRGRRRIGASGKVRSDQVLTGELGKGAWAGGGPGKEIY